MSASTARLDRYLAALEGMTQDERTDFRNAFVAALSFDAADASWDEAVAFARRLVDERRARTTS